VNYRQRWMKFIIKWFRMSSLSIFQEIKGNDW
jgi:hypothetical protein